MFSTLKTQISRIIFIYFLFNVVLSHHNVFGETNQIQKVRINFTGPDDSVRQLLLGFTTDNAATNGVDDDYDAEKQKNLPNDLNWLIEEGRYFIQGVGAFDENAFFELGMFLNDSGIIAINLAALENFDEPVNVYVYDALLNNYTMINDSGYTIEMEAGEYLNRFYIAFTNTTPDNIRPNALSNTALIKKAVTINYNKYTNSLQINFNQDNNLYKVDLYNLQGQLLLSKSFKNEKSAQISLNDTEINNLIIVRVKSKLTFISKKISIH